MRRRVFIAINLPEDIKRKFTIYQDKWPELPIRWTKLDNLHITLIFIGYINDEELLEICKATKEVASRNRSFSVNLNNICYGPPKKMPPRPPKFSEATIIRENKKRPTQKFGWPRMIWVEGKKSKEFASLKNDLEKSLMVSNQIRPALPQKGRERAFSPHITLGRIRTWQWRRIEPEERPDINEEINLTFPVDSIELMESKLKKTGAEYTILESFPLAPTP